MNFLALEKTSFYCVRGHSVEVMRVTPSLPKEGGGDPRGQAPLTPIFDENVQGSTG